MGAGVSEALNLSACLRLGVVDAEGEPLGRLADLEVEASERFPRVVAVRVARGREVAVVPWERVERFDDRGVVVREGAGPVQAGDGRVLRLRRDVLDAQVVDLAGKRLARVGDVVLARQDDELRAVAVDVGLAPVARRLGLRRLARRLRAETLGWDGIYLASGRGHRVQLEHRAADVHRLSQEELAALVAHLPPHRGAEVLDIARPGLHRDPVEAARRARPRRRRFRVMRARKRAPS
jgi:sporulation protein YlmC with PRC-barrel domain